MHDLRPPAKPNWIWGQDDGKVGTSSMRGEVRHQVGGFGYRQVERAGEWRLRSVFNATDVHSDRAEGVPWPGDATGFRSNRFSSQGG